MTSKTLSIEFSSSSAAQSAARVLGPQLAKIPKSGSSVSVRGSTLSISCSSSTSQQCAARLGEWMQKLQSA